MDVDPQSLARLRTYENQFARNLQSEATQDSANVIKISEIEHLRITAKYRNLTYFLPWFERQITQKFCHPMLQQLESILLHWAPFDRIERCN